jgi:hypothetical protein
MKIYHACDDEGGGLYFANKGLAVREARQMAKECGGKYEVVEHEVVAGKAGILALANRRGWSQHSKVVFKITKPMPSPDK